MATRRPPISRLLVLGEQRSGTTLLMDMLDAQPDMRVAVGALSYALRAARSMGLAPLDELTSDQRRALTTALERSLEHSRFDPSVKLPALQNLLDVVNEGLDAIGDGAHIVGTKEHEPPHELAPLLDHGLHLLCIVRDPRDVALSRSRRGETDTARSLVAWRRSAAGVLTIEHPRFQWLRYEDLVSDPVGSLSRVFAAFDWPLDVAAVEGWRLAPERGTNTSFGEVMLTVDRRPLARWRSYQADPVVRYACTVCAPELKSLGYEAGPKVTRRERARHRVHQAYVRTRRRAGRLLRGWLAR